MGLVANLLAVSAAELEQFKHDGEALGALLRHEVEGLRVACLDKSWEGILYLMTGRGLSAQEPEPEGPARALFGGPLLPVPAGAAYGPVHYLEEPETAAVARELVAIVPSELAARYDPAGMMRLGIYPRIWNQGGSDLKDYLLDYFDELKIQYMAAKEKRQAMLSFFTEEDDE